MKIEYVRNMQLGFMRVAISEPLKKTEEEMLSHNEIEGLLPVRWQRENGIYLLRYDITGKQALDALLESSMVDEKLLKCLLSGVYVVMKQLEKYLLSQEGLLLTPETIFWDYRTETMHFCYCPEETEVLQVRLTHLLEYMLAKTDHKNMAAVRLAYGVYEEVLKPTFQLKDLESFLLKATEEAVGTQDYPEEEEYTELPTLQERPYLLKERLLTWKEGVWEKVMAWIKEKIKRQKKAEEVIIMSMETDRAPEEQMTTLLKPPEKEIEGILKYEGTNSLPDIIISHVPFVIGSAGSCDGVIKHPTISRQHAKITYLEDTYFIEDLNSTNGTTAEDGLLSYKTRVSLKKGERICFANEPYRFL